MEIATLVVVLLISVTAHEFAHAWVALREGDPTAQQLGRVTLNPIPHLDPFGSIVLPGLLIYMGSGFLIGWAKPVPVNPNNLRDGRWSDLRVSIAGIVANLILAALSTLLVVATVFATRAFPAAAGALDVIERMAVAGITINFLLAVFNLLPVPPLDGWHVLTDLLPVRVTARLRGLEAAGVLIFVALFLTGVLSTLLWPAFQLERLSWALIRWWT